MIDRKQGVAPTCLLHPLRSLFLMLSFLLFGFSGRQSFLASPLKDPETRQKETLLAWDEVCRLTLGAPAAPIQVVEHISPDCAACLYFLEETFPALQQRFIETGFVRWTFLLHPVGRNALALMVTFKYLSQEERFPLLKAVVPFFKEGKEIIPQLEALLKQKGITRDLTAVQTYQQEEIVSYLLYQHNKWPDLWLPTFELNGHVLPHSAIEAALEKEVTERGLLPVNVLPSHLSQEEVYKNISKMEDNHE